MENPADVAALADSGPVDSGPVDSERARAAMELMADAIERGEEPLTRFLARAAIDDAMRHEVRSLLDAHADSADFLVSPSSEEHESALPARELIGGHRLIEVIGRGGMGIVYLAEQIGLGRRVALKVLAGPRSTTEVARFALESEALARLSHPGIAMVLESGVEGEGPRRLAWLAMELVEGGESITAHAAHRRLDLTRRLTLFEAVCDAVHHGHQKGVIHRDLKPSNILVDRDGNPKVIDFGIARLVADRSGRSRLTETGAMLGTPAFMSPEQFEGGADAVDVRIDVHALGAVLYELLSGAPAFDVGLLPLHRAIDVVRHEEPSRTPLIAAGVPRDVITIILTALEKDVRRRYPSVAALAADLRRFAEHRPIEARAVGAWHRFALLWKRQRPVLIGATLAIGVTVAAAAVSVVSAVDARRAELEADQRRGEAEQRSYVASIAAAESALASREFSRLRTTLAAAPEALRGWEWRHLSERSEPAELVIHAHGRRVHAIAMAPDGSQLWSAGSDGTLRAWDPATGAQLDVRPRHRGLVIGFAMSPDGTILASVGTDGEVVLERRTRAPMSDARELPPVLHRFATSRSSSTDLAFSEDGTLLAAGGDDGRVRIWRTLDGVSVAEIVRAGPVNALLFAGNSEIVVGGFRQDLDRIDLTDRRATRLLDMTTLAGTESAASGGTSGSNPPSSDVTSTRVTDLAWLDVAVEPSRRTVLVALRDRVARAVALAPTGERFRIEDANFAWAFAVSPDGARFATGGEDMHVRLWDSKDARERRVFGGHAENVRTLAFSPDGTSLWSGGWDGTLRRWDARALDRRRDDVPVLEGHTGTIQAVAFSRCGALIASAGRDGQVFLWDPRTRRQLRSWRAHETIVWSVAFSPDGTALATGLDDGTVALWSVATGERIGSLVGHGQRVYAVAFSPDGRRIASASRDRTARIWSRDDDAAYEWRLESTITHDQLVWSVAFSPDGTLLATGSWDHTVRLTSTRDGSTRVVFTGHTDSIYGLAFSPDGSTLASGGRDRRVILWDVAGLHEVRRFEDHGQFITALAFLPDGSRLVGATWWGRTMLWDPRTGATLLALRGSESESSRAVAVSPDGTVIASAGRDEVVWLWCAESGSVDSQSRIHGPGFGLQGTDFAEPKSDSGE